MHRQGRRLALALVASLLVHALALDFLRMPRDRKPQESPVAVVLTARFGQAPQPAANAPAPQPEVAPAPPPSPPPAAAPQAPAKSRAAPQPSHAEPAPEAPDPSEQAMPHADDQVYLSKDQWTTPPRPQTMLDTSELGGVEIVGRRLLVSVWIDDEGVVSRVEVVPYELDPAIAKLLESMVGRVRFAPASLEGRSVRALASSRLCFDDHGQLDTTSKGCWDFDHLR